VRVEVQERVRRSEHRCPQRGAPAEELVRPEIGEQHDTDAHDDRHQPVDEHEAAREIGRTDVYKKLVQPEAVGRRVRGHGVDEQRNVHQRQDHLVHQRILVEIAEGEALAQANERVEGRQVVGHPALHVRQAPGDTDREEHGGKEEDGDDRPDLHALT